MPKTKLRVLLVEDSDDDVLLVTRELQRGGFDAEIEQVQTQADFLKRLHEAQWDVILSDFALPFYDGLSALKDAGESKKDIPFIVLSGSITEDTAVATMRAGAKDYILKDKLARLTPAIERELRDTSKRRQSEEKFRKLLESAPDAMVILGVDGRIVLVNEQTELSFGYQRSDLIGQSVEILLPEKFQAKHPEHRAEYFREPKKRHMGLGPGFDLHGRRKDGTEFPIEVRLSPIETADGLLVSSAIRDITERKRAEASLRRAEQQLRQAHKMEAIGSLAGGVAHDFNNLLSVILSYTDLALDELKPGEPIRADIEEVRKAGERAGALTRQLLAFSRQQMLQPRILDLNEIVTGMETMFRRVLGEDIELSLLTTRRLGKVNADPGQLEQIVMNLVVNARDAMPAGGKLTLETTNTDLDAAYTVDHLDVAPGPYVLLAVTDTGVGIDAETREHIFEPFFTTKEQGKGTGLGLATVFGIVKQSGGHIWVYSEIDRGTTFKIYLPRIDNPAPLDTKAPSPPPPTRLQGTETILLVEDEESVRILARSILRRNGYNVLEAQNGGEAFLICEQYGARIHLLLTDVVMPRMSGRQVAERLAPIRPDMKVIYMSGYTDNAIVHHGVLDSGIAFIQKPITPDALLRKIREVLDAASATTTNTLT